MKPITLVWWLVGVGLTVACGGKSESGDRDIAATPTAGGAQQVVTGASGFGGSGLSSNGGAFDSQGGASTSGTGGNNVAGTGGRPDPRCIIRVAETGDESNDASNWDLAFKSVQKGLDAASVLSSQATCSTVEVW